MAAGRRRKTPGSEAKDFVIHSKAGTRVSAFGGGLDLQFPQGKCKGQTSPVCIGLLTEEEPQF